MAMNDVPQKVVPDFFPSIPDETGLYFRYTFDADGLLIRGPEEPHWTWRSYLLSDIRARKSIENEQMLPVGIREAMLAPGFSCHLDFEQGWLHGDLPDMRHDFSVEARGLGHFRFAFSDTALIGGRKQPLRSVDNVRRMVEGGSKRFRSPAELIETVISQSLDGLSVDLAKISEDLDGIEDRIVCDDWQSERQALTETRRRLVTIHRQMASITSLFRHLDHSHHHELPAALADMVARLSNRAVSLHHDGEQLQARARLLQDELMAKLSAQSNRLLYVLSMMTAVLLPMTIISGLFGMNVGGLPFFEDPHGFIFVSVLSIGAAASVLYALSRIGGGRM
jgi:zinc transporter